MLYSPGEKEDDVLASSGLSEEDTKKIMLLNKRIVATLTSKLNVISSIFKEAFKSSFHCSPKCRKKP